jgi:hypothetical protein
MANSSNSNDKKSQGGSQSEQTPSEQTRSEKVKEVKLPGPNERSTHRRGDSADFNEGENKNSSS